MADFPIDPIQYGYMSHSPRSKVWYPVSFLSQARALMNRAACSTLGFVQGMELVTKDRTLMHPTTTLPFKGDLLQGTVTVGCPPVKARSLLAAILSRHAHCGCWLPSCQGMLTVGCPPVKARSLLAALLSRHAHCWLPCCQGMLTAGCPPVKACSLLAALLSRSSRSAHSA